MAKRTTSHDKRAIQGGLDCQPSSSRNRNKFYSLLIHSERGNLLDFVTWFNGIEMTCDHPNVLKAQVLHITRLKHSMVNVRTDYRNGLLTGFRSPRSSDLDSRSFEVPEGCPIYTDKYFR
jgi:hypothetical protein